MTETHPDDDARIARGRRIVLAAIGVSVFLAVTDIAIAVASASLNPVTTLIRLAILGILLWGMFRGRAWARLLFLILVMVGMAFAGAVAIEPPTVDTDAARVFSFLVIVCGAALVWFLSFDKSVVRYEQAQIVRFPRLFGPEGAAQD